MHSAAERPVDVAEPKRLLVSERHAASDQAILKGIAAPSGADRTSATNSGVLITQGTFRYSIGIIDAVSTQWDPSFLRISGRCPHPWPEERGEVTIAFLASSIRRIPCFHVHPIWL